MTKKKNTTAVQARPETISPLVRRIRGENVMIDSDLAELYGVETGTLNRAVKRNLERFPADFMFQLTREEWADLKCQIGMASSEISGAKGKTNMKLAISKTAVLDWKRKFTHIYRINTSHASVSAPGRFLNIQRGTF